MKTKNNKRTKIIAVLLILVLLISVGYAFLSTTLNINGNATVKSKGWLIYFDNIQTTTGGVTPTTAPTTSGTSTTTLTWAVSMDTPGQFYEFTVDAVNDGSIDAMISTELSNTTLTTNQAKYLDYTVTYSDGAVIEQYDKLAAGTTETLKVRVEFKKDISASDLPAEAETITLTYVSPYVQADSNAKNRTTNGTTVQSLAQSGQIQRWDEIAYNPGTQTTASIELPEGAELRGSKLASVNLPAGASIDGVINASVSATQIGETSGATKNKWLVLDVNQTTGEVLIVPTKYDTTKLTLTGINGYNNGIEALNAVAGIYKNDKYAQSARSITVEDVNKAEGISVSKVATFLGERTHNVSSRYGMNANLDIVDNGEGNEAERTFTTTPETSWYNYLANNNYFSDKDCFLATRAVNYWEGYDLAFDIMILYMGYINNQYGTYGLVSIDEDNGELSEHCFYRSVLPVVVLKPNATIEKVDGLWTFTE